MIPQLTLWPTVPPQSEIPQPNANSKWLWDKWCTSILHSPSASHTDPALHSTEIELQSWHQSSRTTLIELVVCWWCWCLRDGGDQQMNNVTNTKQGITTKLRPAWTVTTKAWSSWLLWIVINVSEMMSLWSSASMTLSTLTRQLQALQLK